MILQDDKSKPEIAIVVVGMNSDADEKFRAIIRDDGRYPESAYEFLFEGLKFTSERHFGPRKKDDSPRHVTGQQLCEGLRELAVNAWGMMAGSVLATWGIRRTRDFGEMVFLLVRNEMMGKRDEDVIEDFDDVYDFREAFGAYEVRVAAKENDA